MKILQTTFLYGIRKGQGPSSPQIPSCFQSPSYSQCSKGGSPVYSAKSYLQKRSRPLAVARCGRGVSVLAVLLGLTASVLALPGLVMAASLQVSPTTIEVNAPGATSSVSLVNPTPQQISVQVRVFKWSQVNGQEKLEPTNDLVASPPFVTLPPSANYAVRLVRTAGRPVAGEESYRLVIDELPQPGRLKAGAITLLLRQSLPVFFEGPDMRPPQVSWSYSKQGGKLLVTAKNDGDRRMRIGSLSLSNGKGSTVSFGNGLVGYSLGRSVMTWVLSGRKANLSVGGTATLNGQSDLGPINAKAEPQGH